MRTQLERSIEPCTAEYDAVLITAALSGTDLTPCVDGQRFVGIGNTKYGHGPACVIDLIETPYVAEPHVVWFPWTSPSDRILNFKWAMEYLGKEKEVFLTVQKSQISFFEHFAKKGFLRKVGFINNLPEVEEIHMYQYERKR